MEVEAECDRQNLCQKIIAMVDLQVQNSLNQSGLSFQNEQPTASPSHAAENKKETKASAKDTAAKEPKGKRGGLN